MKALLIVCPQLMLTVGLLAVVVYLYTVVAFNFFRKFYNKSEDEDDPDMKCDDMMTVSILNPIMIDTVVRAILFHLYYTWINRPVR